MDYVTILDQEDEWEVGGDIADALRVENNMVAYSKIVQLLRPNHPALVASMRPCGGEDYCGVMVPTEESAHELRALINDLCIAEA